MKLAMSRYCDLKGKLAALIDRPYTHFMLNIILYFSIGKVLTLQLAANIYRVCSYPDQFTRGV